jgi:hypothetical protein
MDHRPAESMSWSPNPAEIFSGRVWSCRLSQSPDRILNAIAVMFEPGARSFGTHIRRDRSSTSPQGRAGWELPTEWK